MKVKEDSFLFEQDHPKPAPRGILSELLPAVSPFQKCSHYSESFVLFCEDFCCLLLLLFNVLILFVCFTYLSRPPPEVIGWKNSYF